MSASAPSHFEGLAVGGPLDGDVLLSTHHVYEVDLDRDLLFRDSDAPVASRRRGVYKLHPIRIGWMDFLRIRYDFTGWFWLWAEPFERFEAHREWASNQLLAIAKIGLAFAHQPTWPEHHEWVSWWQVEDILRANPSWFQGGVTDEVCRWCFVSRRDRTPLCHSRF